MMERKETIKRLDQMIKKGQFDIEKLTEIAEEYKVELPKNQNCGDCWKDFAFVLRSMLKTEEMKTEGRKYILKDGVDVIFKGERINNGMLTDKKAKQLIEEGFATYLFAVMPDADND